MLRFDPPPVRDQPARFVPLRFAWAEEAPAAKDATPNGPADVALILRTSGTTSRPKVALDIDILTL